LALAYVAADNELGRLGDPDQAALAAILEESRAQDGELLEAMGYDDESLQSLLDAVAKTAGKNNIDDQVEDFPVSDLLAPYPYFGGKRAIAGAVWARFGTVDNYVEPFFGSGAVLLSRPNVTGIETINDFDGFIANFWRAVAADPESVARFVDWPVNENDLFARHLWLVNQRDALTEHLHTDPDWYDAKIAGWWCWGICNWIGDGWCSGDGPWRVDGGEVTNRTGGGGVRAKGPHLGDAGQGVNRGLPHLGNAGRGVNRVLPHLGDAGQGVNRGLPHLGNAGQGDQTEGQCEAWAGHLSAMMGKLSDRLRRVRVTCGDWSRVVKSSVTDRHGLTAVFLDPPYGLGAMEYANGGNASAQLAADVRRWAIENGDNPELRIALCGYEPLPMPEGWRALRWSAPKGYQGAEAAENRHREIIWFNWNCQTPTLAEAT
ncbi:MAG: DNA adenine methylase, partial [Caldilineaceae bacterium]|nr:DNA adenine methylase [Caldilineaceae bacterium]